MVNNTYGNCKYCGTKFRLRYQIGFVKIPVYFSCPKCSVIIKGNITFEYEKIYPQIRNFELSETEEVEYVVEQSSEFLQRKIYKEEDNIDISPFMRTTLLFDDIEDMQKSFLSLYNVVKFKNEKLNFIEDMLEILYNNQNSEIFIDIISNENPKNNIKNELDAYIQLHQSLILGISPMLKKEMLPIFIKKANAVTNLACTKEEGTNKLIKYLLEDNILNAYEIKILNVISDFTNMIESFIPIIVPAKIDAIESIDQNMYGISTIGFRELKNFYSFSYENLIKSVDIIIYLNNLEYRNNFSTLISNDTFSNLDELEEKTNKFSKKIEKLIDKNEHFSDQIFDLDSIIRNSINHESYDIDEINQTIKFIDKYKDRIREKEISYLDFAKICYDNFLMSVYIFEIIYNLKKVKYVNIDKLSLNFRPNNIRVK